MQHLLASVLSTLLLMIISAHGVQSLSYDPSKYLDVYPDPRDPAVLKGRTPLHFSLIQSLGGPLSQFDAAGSVAGVQLALDMINNDSSLLQGYTLHYTFANSQCNRKVSLDVLHSQLLQEPKKLAVIGSGCSVATEPTAEISHYYNITQISCVSSSPELSNRTRFPRYFQLLSSSVRRALGFYGVIKQYGWRRVALIVQNENVFTVTITKLKELLDADEDVNYSEETFNTGGGVADLSDPFGNDARIFIFSMYRGHAAALLCEAYKRGLSAPQYVFLTIGWYIESWWRVDYNLTCTPDELESVLFSMLAVSDEIFLDEELDANITTTPGLTVGEFLTQEQRFWNQPPLNLNFSQYSPYCYDATWILAYALNKTLNSLGNSTVNEEISQAFNITPPFGLEDFTYSNNKVLEIIFQHLHSTSFNGTTGTTTFGEDGIREIANLDVLQYRNVTGEGRIERERIGNVLENGSFTYIPGEDNDTVWNGTIPYDGVPMNMTVTVHPAITAVYITFASVGIGFAIACLIFNFICRTAKLIKLASAKLNYLIGVGAIILYLDTFFFVIPTTSPGVVTAFCNLTPWLTAIGYSLCYGTILAKMARVFFIFRNPTANKKKKITDRYLILGVASMVAIDLIILVTYTLVEGIMGNLDARRVAHSENPRIVAGDLGIITDKYIYICDNSTAYKIFLGVLYGYKMVLQIIALLLAFSIRKVKVKGLNDAKYIAAAIYVTSVVLALIILATYTLNDFINGFAALFCTGFLVGTTVILILVFVPLMVGLYKDPKGENIFKNSTNNQTAIGLNENYENTENDVPGLRKRIRDLEVEVKEKEEFISAMQEQKLDPTLPAVENTHNGNSNGTSGRTIWDTPLMEPLMERRQDITQGIDL